MRTVKLHTRPRSGAPLGKAALQAGGAAKGRPGLGAHWGHPANGPPLSRAKQPSGFCAGSAGLRLLLLSDRATAESSSPGGSPLCSALLPGTRCSAVPLGDTGQYGRYSRPRAAPGQPGRLCLHHRDPDYIANSSYFYWKVGRIGQDATFVLLEIDACALARTQPIMRVLEHHEFAVPAVPPEYLALV